MRKNGGNGDGNSLGHGGKEKEGNEEELVGDSWTVVALWEEEEGEWEWW